MTVGNAVSLILVVLAGIMFHLIPQLSRADIFFGLTVDPGTPKSEAGRAITRRYRAVVWSVTGVAALLAAWGASALAWVMPLQAFAVTVAFLAARREVRPYAVAPSQTREAVLAVRRERLPGGLAAVLGPFVILGLAEAIVRANWEKMPEKIPVHWGADFKADRWVDTTPSAIHGLLITGAVLAGVMLLLAYAILFSRHVNTSGAAAEREGRYRALNAKFLIGVAYFMAFIFAFTVMMPLASRPDDAAIVSLVSGVIVILPLIALVYVLTRFSREPAVATDTAIGDKTPDERWYWGMFYFNSDDPALIVEKRFGFGYTLNMARPAAWIITAALLALPFMLARLT